MRDIRKPSTLGVTLLPDKGLTHQIKAKKTRKTMKSNVSKFTVLKGIFMRALISNVKQQSIHMKTIESKIRDAEHEFHMTIGEEDYKAILADSVTLWNALKSKITGRIVETEVMLWELYKDSASDFHKFTGLTEFPFKEAMKSFRASGDNDHAYGISIAGVRYLLQESRVLCGRPEKQYPAWQKTLDLDNLGFFVHDLVYYRPTKDTSDIGVVVGFTHWYVKIKNKAGDIVLRKKENLTRRMHVR